MKATISYIKCKPGSESAFKDWLDRQEQIKHLDRVKVKVELKGVSYLIMKAEGRLS